MLCKTIKSITLHMTSKFKGKLCHREQSFTIVVYMCLDIVKLTKWYMKVKSAFMQHMKYSLIQPPTNNAYIWSTSCKMHGTNPRLTPFVYNKKYCSRSKSKIYQYPINFKFNSLGNVIQQHTYFEALMYKHMCRFQMVHKHYKLVSNSTRTQLICCYSFFFLKIFFNSIKNKTLEGYNLNLATKKVTTFFIH